MPIQFAALLPTLVSTAVGIGAKLLNNKLNKKAANEQNRYNYNLWKEQTQYNLPSEQIKRLKDAGINPNMYMSQVVGTNSADAAAPSANLANQEAIFDPQTGADIAKNLLENAVSKQNADANTTAANAAAQNAATEAARQKVDAMMTESNIGLNNEKKKVYVEQVKQIDAQNQNLAKQYEILDEQKKQAVIKTARDNIEKNLYEQYGEKEIQADLNLKAAQADVAISQKTLNYVTAKLAPEYLAAAKEQADAATLNAESGWLNSQTNVQQVSKQIEKVNAEIDKMVKDGELSEAQATFFKSFTAEKLLGMAITVGSFFIPGGFLGKAGKAVQYGKKAYKAAKVARTATKAQKAAGKAMAHPKGSFTPAGSRQMRNATVNPHM